MPLVSHYPIESENTMTDTLRRHLEKKAARRKTIEANRLRRLSAAYGLSYHYTMGTR